MLAPSASAPTREVVEVSFAILSVVRCRESAAVVR